MYKNKKVIAIILAAGKGKRFDENIPKQYFKINGETILEKVVDKISHNSYIDGFFIVVGKNEMKIVGELISEKEKLLKVIEGGRTRQESTTNALKELDDDAEYILIHDGARPFVSQEMINTVVENIDKTGAVIPITDMIETVKEVTGCIVDKTLNRSKLKCVQTPQGFKKQVILESYEKMDKTREYTDDSSVVEYNGNEIFCVDGESTNIKITKKSDILRENRVGHGYDVHRIVDNRKMILGGVEIPYEKGLAGHSDADVLIHAIMDSLLGAAGLQDIGVNFPDNNEEFKDISSMKLLKEVGKMLENENWEIVNIDATVIAEKPKISGYVQTMKKNIAENLKISHNRINIKGTTTEKLGFIGKKEGIAAEAIAMIQGV